MRLSKLTKTALDAFQRSEKKLRRKGKQGPRIQSTTRLLPGFLVLLPHDCVFMFSRSFERSSISFVSIPVAPFFSSVACSTPRYTRLHVIISEKNKNETFPSYAPCLLSRIRIAIFDASALN